MKHGLGTDIGCKCKRGVCDLILLEATADKVSLGCFSKVTKQFYRFVMYYLLVYKFTFP